MTESVPNWHALVLQELQTRNWTLVTPDDAFFERVRNEIHAAANDPAAAPVQEVRRATVRCCARLLYDACGEDGTSRQRRAFEELWAYPYPRALMRVHNSGAAQDVAQQALVKIFAKRTTCRDAGSFLRWCEQILLREISDRFRELYERRLSAHGEEYIRREIGLEEMSETENSGSASANQALSASAHDTAHAALQDPMRAALLDALRDCLGNERHVLVIVDLFMRDASFVEAADHLGTTPLNIQVIKARALKKLRDCPDMQRIVEDWTV